MNRSPKKTSKTPKAIQPPFDPKTDWKVIIPWIDRTGRVRKFEAYGRAHATLAHPEGSVAAEFMLVVHATSLNLVAAHPEAGGQKGDVQVYHPALNLPGVKIKDADSVPSRD